MAITLKNKVAGTAGGSPRTVTFGFTATSGNLLVANVTTTTDSGSAPTFTAGWTQVTNGTVLSGTTRRVTTFYKISDGTESSAVATQAGVASLDTTVIEYNSTVGWPSNPVDQVNTQTSSGSSVTSLTSISVTTLYPNEVIVYGVGLAAHTNAAFTNSFTVENDDLNQCFDGDLIVTSAGTYSTSPSWTTSRVACGVMVSFRDATPASSGGIFPANTALQQRYRIVRRGLEVTGGTLQSDATFTGSVQQTPTRSVRQFLDLLQPRNKMRALIPRNTSIVGGTIQSDSTLTGTGSVRPTLNLMQRMLALRPRTGVTLPLAPNISIVGGTVASDATFTGQVTNLPKQSARALIERQQRLDMQALLSRNRTVVGGTIQSDSTLTGSVIQGSTTPVLLWLLRMGTAPLASPTRNVIVLGGTIQSDSTLTGTLSNDSVTVAPTQQVGGGAWHRVGDKLPDALDEEFDFDFELETLVLFLAVAA